ncbi:hypothetical protein GCM10010464_25440 [Pseudonocardia yunnanensis]|uniref:Secreted protein n=1 Tax=Pseudonocardia yunnanensis TaxID=58107 RepID=A0ABW4F361_9PSEU
MLKKAGIVVAVATAGLLAVAPLAFAADRGDSNDRADRGSSSESVGYVGVDSEYDGATCDYGNYSEAANQNAGTANTLALLGAAAGALTQTFTPAFAPVETLAPVGACDNLTFEDNRTDNDTAVEGSFNE